MTVTTAAGAITTPKGDTIMVYVDIYRDSATGEILAAEPRVKDAHGNSIRTATALLRERRSISATDERQEVTVW
jgi:hypothetical protein